MAKGWFVDDTDHWCYADENGQMLTNEFVDGCYVDGNGYMVTGWKYIDGHWYFFKNSGYMAKGWIKDAGKWYYFNDEGIMQVGVSPDGYLLSKDGHMVVNNWAMVDGKWYYADKNGKAIKDQWKKIDGCWYYFYEDGHMAVDERTPDGSYVDENGCWVDTQKMNVFSRMVFSLLH